MENKLLNDKELQTISGGYIPQMIIPGGGQIVRSNIWSGLESAVALLASRRKSQK